MPKDETTSPMEDDENADLIPLPLEGPPDLVPALTLVAGAVNQTYRLLQYSSKRRDRRIRQTFWACVLVFLVGLAGGVTGVSGIMAARRANDKSDSISAALVTANANLAQLAAVQADACADRKNGWQSQHDTVVEQNKVQPANPILIKAFPEFKPFFTPGTPEYAEAQRIADDKRDRALHVLGPKPVC